MSSASAIVDTHAEAAKLELAPLLVREPLAAFLDAHGLGGGEPIEAEPVGEGHSNVTYLITRGETQLVLRRPPRPPLPPSAHDVLREARLLTAVEQAAVRTPRVLATCDDEAVIGAPFYVMEMVQGDVITTQVSPALDSLEQRQRIGDELIDALVEIHAVDWRACGLEGYGKPTGYLERQLRRFSGLWEHNKTREIDDARPRHRVARRALPGVRRGDDRPRRLSPRQHDVRAGRARAPDLDLRLGAARRSATRSPTSAT